MNLIPTKAYPTIPLSPQYNLGTRKMIYNLKLLLNIDPPILQNTSSNYGKFHFPF
jgi:hypothetical protein